MTTERPGPHMQVISDAYRMIQNFEGHADHMLGDADLSEIRRRLLTWPHPIKKPLDLARAALLSLLYDVRIVDGQIQDISKPVRVPISKELEHAMVANARVDLDMDEVQASLAKADELRRGESWGDFMQGIYRQIDDGLGVLRGPDGRVRIKRDEPSKVPPAPNLDPVLVEKLLLRRTETEEGLFSHADVYLVSRYRESRDLDPERQPLATSFAVSEQEAFAELLRLSGLDEQEIADYDLTFERLTGPAPLLEELKAITGDTYEIAVHEVPLPLRPSVKGQFEG
ncbi:hypothetical protein [Methylobacterium oryzae]|uniref:hypothetical protein n=1 Tax=Methylobacterium oryzae TaxID=334852 RepID=UPI001F4282D2|nr:hypothetical protein [Methylobacterium oryzae]UIN38395.1 hypothetical protein LXM90_30905 [Methylobacterium oryzae]